MKNSRFVHRGRNFIRHLKDRMRLSRRSFILYSILRALVILVLVRSVLAREYENVALCILSLVLFLMPALAEQQLKIEIPPLFEALIYLFIFAAEISISTMTERKDISATTMAMLSPATEQVLT